MSASNELPDGDLQLDSPEDIGATLEKFRLATEVTLHRLRIVFYASVAILLGSATIAIVRGQLRGQSLLVILLVLSISGALWSAAVIVGHRQDLRRLEEAVSQSFPQNDLQPAPGPRDGSNDSLR